MLQMKDALLKAGVITQKDVDRVKHQDLAAKIVNECMQIEQMANRASSLAFPPSRLDKPSDTYRFITSLYNQNQSRGFLFHLLQAFVSESARDKVTKVITWEQKIHRIHRCPVLKSELLCETELPLDSMSADVDKILDFVFAHQAYRSPTSDQFVCTSTRIALARWYQSAVKFYPSIHHRVERS